MIKLYKDGEVANADTSQKATFLKAGWSLTKKGAQKSAPKESTSTTSTAKKDAEETKAKVKPRTRKKD